MAKSNLTERQRSIVRELVRRYSEGFDDEFLYAPTMGVEPGIEFPGAEGHVRAYETDLLTLEQEGFVTLRRPDQYSIFGTIRQLAFDAVKSDFEESGSGSSGDRGPRGTPMAEMSAGSYGRWQPIRLLEEGGQGKVFLALDTSQVKLDEAVAQMQVAVQVLAGGHTPEDRRRRAEELAGALKVFAAGDDPLCQGALKVLHPPKDPTGWEKAKARMENEVRVYESIEHPSLLRILDKNLSDGWFVTEFQPRGPLSHHLHLYQGDPVAALRAIRPLVEAVSQLHSQGAVHRDIKPGNIFVRTTGELVLGDTGLVFFADAGRSRVSDKIENVGSRDWMPGWAMGMRLEDVRPTFDVFTLGKVLWAMVSGKPILQLWYHRQARFDLGRQFPDDERMPLINRLLDGCIVEHEGDIGFPSAVELLSQVDAVLEMLRRGGQVVHRTIERRCEVCGLGRYQAIVDETSGSTAVRNFGLNPVVGQSWRIFRCVRCGHVQMFQMNPNPPGWGEP